VELYIHSCTRLHSIHSDNFTFEDAGHFIPLFANFTTNSNNQIEININYNNKSIPTIAYAEFLGLTIVSSLMWLKHIDLLTKIIKHYMLLN
jgi:hypothetical protein